MSQIWMCDRCGKIANSRTRKYGIILGSLDDDESPIKVELDSECMTYVRSLFKLDESLVIEGNTRPKENGVIGG
jgi:hypothetical protein